MTKAGVLPILGLLIAAPVAARPVLQPFGGRAVLMKPVSGEGISGERLVLTLRNQGSAGAVYRLVWLDADRRVIGRSNPGRLGRDASVPLDVGAIARSLGLAWNRGTLAVEWASERFTRVSATAVLLVWDCEVGSSIPVEEEPPRPIRWAELQAISQR